jgi:methylphosphotriester-DNA--protein-cysteine methyltransferase
VLETEKDTNFRQLVDGHRVSFATSLLLARPGASIDLEKIASLSGFKHVEDLDEGFQSILGMTAADYLRHSDQQSDCQRQEDSANQRHL